MTGMKLTTFIRRLGTDEACRAHLESVRWPDGPICPRCGSMNDASAVSTRPGLYRCRACNKQFTVTVGTTLEGSHVPLRTWYLAMYIMLSAAKPISAMSLSRQLEIQYRTCWHMLRRLRGMLAGGEKLPLSGFLKADETDVGGNARSRHEHREKSTGGRGGSKPVAFAAIERSGEAPAAVVPFVGALALDALPFGWFDRGGALRSAELTAYDWFGRKLAHHDRINPVRRGEADIRVQVDTVAGFFGLFKRVIFGIHHSVWCKHRNHCAAEHTLRYKCCTDDASSRIARCLIGQRGRLRLWELFA
jgi:transposase-like protein